MDGSAAGQSRGIRRRVKARSPKRFTCVECRAVVDSGDHFCHECGQPNPAGTATPVEDREWRGIALVVGIILVLLGAGALYDQRAADGPVAEATPAPTRQEIAAAHPRLSDLSELAIRPGPFFGRRLSFTGEVRRRKMPKRSAGRI